ncbi:MAG: hypothetical protein AAF485_22085 [Chloroflexota bacterium]
MPKILIAMEESDSQALIKLVLEHKGHLCLCVDNVRQVVTTLHDGSTNLMIFSEELFLSEQRAVEEHLEELMLKMQTMGVIILIHRRVHWTRRSPDYYDYIDHYIHLPFAVDELLNKVEETLQKYER